MTNGEINRLGEKILLSKSSPYGEDLDSLQEFRISFATPLTEVFQHITSLSTKVHRASIVAFRLKRISTIINKVHRNPQMKLSRMGDIAGIRCIFYNEREVYKFIELIKKNFQTKGRIRDYILDPKDIGYKAIHIHVVHKSSGKQIEIQVRTIAHHNWATLIEITDLLYNLRLKEIGSSSHQKFAKFHSLLSSDIDLTKSQANLIYDVLKEHNFITKLNETFRRNIGEVKRQWLSRKNTDCFHLISVKKNEVPLLESFSDFRSAEKVYFEKYKKESETEIVLTYIKKPNFQQISIAYANYILSYHTFMKDIEPIIEQLALDSLAEKKISKFKKIFITYEELQVSHLLDVLTESRELLLSRLEKQKLIISKNRSLSRGQEKEIRDKINSFYKAQSNQYNGFINEIYSNLPSSSIKNYIVRQFLKKHNKRIRKSLKVQQITIEK